MLTGADAARSAVEGASGRTRWMHLATHGWYRSVDGSRAEHSEDELRSLAPMLLSRLAFAGAAHDPYAVVSAEELSSWDLSCCELAVLSACETSLGELRSAGQGVASLQKALHIAGARSVITSLWSVSDTATREMMVDFYRRLWIDEQPKARALWEAKRAMRDSGHPSADWAGWILTGSPE